MIPSPTTSLKNAVFAVTLIVAATVAMAAAVVATATIVEIASEGGSTSHIEKE